MMDVLYALLAIATLFVLGSIIIIVGIAYAHMPNKKKRHGRDEKGHGKNR